jgi:hypothetical protein
LYTACREKNPGSIHGQLWGSWASDPLICEIIIAIAWFFLQDNLFSPWSIVALSPSMQKAVAPSLAIS